MRNTYGIKKPGSMGKTAAPAPTAPRTQSALTGPGQGGVNGVAPAPAPAPTNTRPPAPGVASAAPAPAPAPTTQGGSSQTVSSNGVMTSNMVNGVQQIRGISGGQMAGPPEGYNLNPDRTIKAPTRTQSAVTGPGQGGVNGVAPASTNLYDQMAQQDMEAAQRDRDVSRAAGMREMREGAISQGIGPGTQRYQAMARDAEAGANQYGQQSRNDAANRAQGLMMDKKEDQEEQANNYVNTLSENEQRAFFDLKASGMNDIDALKTMKSMDIKQNSALDDEIKERVEEYVRIRGMSKSDAAEKVRLEMDTELTKKNEDAANQVRLDGLKESTTENVEQIKTALKDAGFEDSGINVLEKMPKNLAVTPKNVQKVEQQKLKNKAQAEMIAATLNNWDEDTWATAEENNLIPMDLLPDSGIGSDSTTKRWISKGFVKGQFRRSGDTVIKVIDFNNSEYIHGGLFGKNYHKGGKLEVEIMTGPNKGQTISYFDAKNQGLL
tara:strand:- start:323 stop:1804 length:1482 start_codon:yes stop_codon:yes gene_type:complete